MKSNLFGCLFVVGMILVSSLFFTSCKTTEKTIIEKHDTLIVYRDTIITIKEHGDTFYMPAIVLYDTIIVNKENKKLDVKYLNIDSVRVICRENEYKIKLDSVIKYTQMNHKIVKTKIIYECKDKWHDFTSYFFWVMIALMIIYISIKK